MSNIIPLTLRPHLVSFLMKEMKGETITFAGSRVAVYDISRKSFIGKYLLEHLEKIKYPVKNISRFNFFAEIKASSRSHREVRATGAFYKKEKLGDTFVYLPERYVDEVNHLFEEQFRSAFFNFVEARAESDLWITQAILLFIDKYQLFECELNQDQLRQVYNRMKKSGMCAGLQGKLYRG